MTDLMVRQAKPKEKRYGLSDGRGLLLEVRPNGSKFWVARIWTGGKERRQHLGRWPDVSVRDARVLGVSGIRVRELCQDGRFRGAFKFGGTWIIPRAAVEGHERLPPGRRPRKSRDAALLDAFRAAAKEQTTDEEG